MMQKLFFKEEINYSNSPHSSSSATLRRQGDLDERPVGGKSVRMASNSIRTQLGKSSNNTSNAATGKDWTRLHPTTGATILNQNSMLLNTTRNILKTREPSRLGNASLNGNDSTTTNVEANTSAHLRLSDDATNAYKWLLKTNKTKTRGVLFNTKGVLDLLPWERESITDSVNVTDSQGTTRLFGKCNSPRGVADYCCLGSYSGGGGTSTRYWSHHCFKGEDVYQRVADTVLHDLHRTNAMVDDDCDVCRIVDLLNKFHLKLAFLGDSVMAQNFDGFTCELARRGYTTKLIQNKLVNPEAKFGLKNIYTHKISYPTQPQKKKTTKKKMTATNSITVDLLFQHKLQYGNNMSEVEWMSKTYDVLVMNFGLHFPHEAYYLQRMSQVFNATRQGNVTLLAHRETTAQHFQNAGGEWSEQATWAGCVPHSSESNSTILLGWRDRAIERKATELGYKVVVADETLSGKPVTDHELVILPFFNVTSSFHYLHPDECTHFCSTPYLWMPVWRGLRLAMDRIWPVTTSSTTF